MLRLMAVCMICAFSLACDSTTEVEGPSSQVERWKVDIDQKPVAPQPGRVRVIIPAPEPSTPAEPGAQGSLQGPIPLPILVALVGSIGVAPAQSQTFANLQQALDWLESQPVDVQRRAIIEYERAGGEGVSISTPAHDAALDLELQAPAATLSGGSTATGGGGTIVADLSSAPPLSLVLGVLGAIVLLGGAAIALIPGPLQSSRLKLGAGVGGAGLVLIGLAFLVGWSPMLAAMLGLLTILGLIGVIAWVIMSGERAKAQLPQLETDRRALQGVTRAVETLPTNLVSDQGLNVREIVKAQVAGRADVGRPERDAIKRAKGDD